MGFGMISTGFSQSTLNDGLIAYYQFNGNANDETSNGHNGEVHGASLTTDRFGNINSAYEFDGNNDFIKTLSTFDFPDRTLSLWVNPYDISGSNTTINVAITQDDNDLNYGILRVEFNDNGIKLWAGGMTGTYSNNSINTNSWVHLVLIREENVSKYYIDNVLTHTATADSAGSTYNPISDFIIGSGRSTTNQFFHGIIDDIRVYNRVLSSSEIDDIYNESNPALSVSVNHQQVNNINIYPNPARETIHISSNGKVKALKLFNILGKVVIDTKNTKNLSIQNIPKGIYTLSIELENGIIKQEKIVKY